MEKDTVLNALKTVQYPNFTRDIVSFGLVRDVEIQDKKVTVRLVITTSDATVPEKLRTGIDAALKKIGVMETEISIETAASKMTPPPQNNSAKNDTAAPKIARHVIAIASGKGGVGKSTFAVNFACALAKMTPKKLRVGLLDCDVYGPSIPLMLGIHGQLELDGDRIAPAEKFGLKVMSLGFLVDEMTPIIWRGPMVLKAIQQFAGDVAWGELDVLVVDLPPGTGDAPLSLVQTIPLSGAIIVTTPQKAAASVAQRGAMLFSKTQVPVLGVVENMSFLENENGAREHIFGEGGGNAVASALAVPLLGQVPLKNSIREGGDNGLPMVIARPDDVASLVFMGIAGRIAEKLMLA